MIPKFRVWFSEASQMITDDLESINLFDKTVTITSGYYDSFPDDYILSSIEVDIGNAILMQSTGLLDKNGVEIFEGDIVHLTSDEGIDYNSLIVFKDGGFCAIDGTESNYGLRRYGLSRFDLYLDVIGNVHENPELLEVVE